MFGAKAQMFGAKAQMFGACPQMFGAAGFSSSAIGPSIEFISEHIHRPRQASPRQDIDGAATWVVRGQKASAHEVLHQPSGVGRGQSADLPNSGMVDDIFADRCRKHQLGVRVERGTCLPRHQRGGRAPSRCRRSRAARARPRTPVRRTSTRASCRRRGSRSRRGDSWFKIVARCRRAAEDQPQRPDLRGAATEEPVLSMESTRHSYCRSRDRGQVSTAVTDEPARGRLQPSEAFAAVRSALLATEFRSRSSRSPFGLPRRVGWRFRRLRCDARCARRHRAAGSMPLQSLRTASRPRRASACQPTGDVRSRPPTIRG